LASDAFKSESDKTEPEEEEKQCPCDSWKYDEEQQRVCTKCFRIMDEIDEVYEDKQYRPPPQSKLKQTHAETKALKYVQMNMHADHIIEKYKHDSIFKLIIPFVKPAVDEVNSLRKDREKTTKMKDDVCKKCLICAISAKCHLVTFTDIRMFFEERMPTSEPERTKFRLEYKNSKDKHIALSSAKRLFSEMQQLKTQQNKRETEAEQ